MEQKLGEFLKDPRTRQLEWMQLESLCVIQEKNE